MSNKNSGNINDKKVTRPPQSHSDYNISSNNNIFPQQSQQQRPSVSFNREPVSLPSNNRMNYESLHQQARVHSPQSQSQSQSREIDPISKLSHAFDSFARSAPTKPVSSSHVVPNNVLTPPAPIKEQFAIVSQNETDSDYRDDDDCRMTLEKNILGDQRMATYAYPNVYSEPRGAHFIQPPQNNLILNPKPLYLHVDSTYRNRDKYPDPSHYVMPLVASNDGTDTSGERYKDIYQISLLSVTIPNIPQVFVQPYLLLQIDEIQGHYDSANVYCKKAFTRMCFEESGTSSFVKLDKDVNEPAVVVFYPAPLASLDRLTISIRNPDGTLFNFGTDALPPQVPNPLFQNSFTFQIVSKVVDVIETIGHRNP